MDELLQQKAAVVNRIRNLRRQLRGKRVFQGDERVASENGALNLRNRRRSRKAAIHRSRDTMQFSYDDLRRACRIALLEAGGAANAERIYSLIVRRGSFVFSDSNEQALDAVEHALSTMHEAGELSLSNEDQTSCSRVVFQMDADCSDAPESVRSS